MSEKFCLSSYFSFRHDGSGTIVDPVKKGPTYPRVYVVVPCPSFGRGPRGRPTTVTGVPFPFYLEKYRKDTSFILIKSYSFSCSCTVHDVLRKIYVIYLVNGATRILHVG